MTTCLRCYQWIPRLTLQQVDTVPVPAAGCTNTPGLTRLCQPGKGQPAVNIWVWIIHNNTSVMCLDIYKMHDFNTQCVCKVCVKTWQNCYWDLWDVEDRLTTLYLHTPSSKLISVWLMKTVSCTSTSLPITYSALQLFLPKVENEFQGAKDAQSWRYRWY